MNGRNDELIQLQKGKIIFNYRRALYQYRRFENLGSFINYFSSRLTIIFIAEMSGFTRIMFDGDLVSVANNYANSFGRECNTILLEGDFLGYPNIQLCTGRFYIQGFL